MKNFPKRRRGGFTLMETVIAIGVLAVLLSGFMYVFTPAAEGIRKSINVQQADRLTSALERELTTQRKGGQNYATGFDKAFEWLKDSKDTRSILVVYQYRAELGGNPRQDGTLPPQASITNKLPGKDYVVVPMVRQLGDNDQELGKDLEAIEGALYVVKCTQLVFDSGSGGLIASTKDDQIVDPKNSNSNAASADAYPEAVIAFSADFYQLPNKTMTYLTGTAFRTKFPQLKNPVFSRNLAVRR